MCAMPNFSVTTLARIYFDKLTHSFQLVQRHKNGSVAHVSLLRFEWFCAKSAHEPLPVGETG